MNTTAKYIYAAALIFQSLVIIGVAFLITGSFEIGAAIAAGSLIAPFVLRAIFVGLTFLVYWLASVSDQPQEAYHEQRAA